MSDRILFIELLGGIGDVLIALPAIQSLAATHPNASLTVLTFSPGGELLLNHPQISRVIQTPKGTAKQAVEKIITTETFDLIVTDTTYEGIDKLVLNSGTKRTVVNLWRNPPNNELASDRFLKILQQEQLISPTAAHQHRLPKLYLIPSEKVSLPHTNHPRICLYPDAGMSIKRWSPERFISLGQQIQKQYNARIFVPIGEHPEQAEAIATQIPSARIWPRGPLRQLAAFIANMDAFIADDTGPARIAAALNVPTITLFGPSWRDRFGQPAPHINLQAYPHCPERRINFTEQTCWYSGHCPYPWPTCTSLIPPEDIINPLQKILSPPLPCSPAPPPPTWKTARNILAIRLDNIGDVIMTAPALKALKLHHPNTRLTLLASPAGSQAAAVLPWVDHTIVWRSLWQDLGELPLNPKREWQLVEQLAAERFDAAIIFTSFKQSPHPPAFICQLAGIPLRLGESQEQENSTLTDRITLSNTSLHQVERNIRLIESVSYQVTNREIAISIPPSSQIPDEPYILFNPWTSCHARTYPPMRFAQAACLLSDQTGLPIVITGTEQQAVLAAPLLNLLGDRAINRIGTTTLSDLVALVANAQLMLSNNTATMHIADATQTPSVITFSGTELPSQWQPRHTRATLLQRSVPCAPCYRFECPYNLECLDIAPEEIAHAGQSLLTQKGNRLFVA